MQKTTTTFIQLLLLAATVLLTNCAHTQTALKPATRETATQGVRKKLTYNESQRLKYFYYEAINQQEKNNYSDAFELLRHCLTIDPTAPEVNFTIAAYYGAMKNDSLAMQSYEKAAAMSPANATFQERLAQMYIGTKDMEKAAQAYENIYQANRSRTDVLYTLMKLYNYMEDYDQMLRTLDRIEAVEGSNEEIAISRMGIYEELGDKKKALNVLKKLTEEHPLDMNYRVMMGNWLLQNGKSFEALKEYNKVLEAEPGNQEVRMSLLDYYRTVGKDSTARMLQEQLLISPNTPSQTKMQLMKNVVAENEQQGGDSTKVLDLFARILQEPQENADMVQLCAAYMSLKEMPQDTINAMLEKALEIEPDEASVRQQLIQALWEEKDFDRVIQVCIPATEYNPEEMVFYYFLGMAYFQKNDKDNALEAFRQGVTQINEQTNKNLASDFYAIMGDILHEKDRTEEAFAAYDSALQWKPDNSFALNNYAYFLCLEGKDLQKAEQMSYKSIKADPTNANNLDTYAWILFNQERYEEAKTYIEQAIANDSVPSSTVLEHAGDIYANCDDMEKAMEYWQKAYELGDGSPLLARKIKLKKYIKEK